MKGRLLLFATAAAVTSIFFIDFCALVYQCGCRSLWAGADAACNVHTVGTKHCPWCSIGLIPSVGVWAVIVASQGLIALYFNDLTSLWRVVLTFAAFPIVGAILALLLGLSFGYWW